jgi:AcrR family transcriptional regulator
MGPSRGDSNVTRRAILAAARDLFARHGVDGVSVRQIAAAAGINHALVHRYFGTKDEMVAAIMLGEARALSEMARPEADPLTSLTSLAEAFRYLLSEGRTSLLLMMRAELDGMAPERLIEGSPLRPLTLLADWLERGAGQAARPPAADPRLVAMVLGAAIMGLASMQPMLAAGAGVQDRDPDEVLQGCLQAAVGLAAIAIGAQPPAVEDPAPSGRPGAVGGETAAGEGAT